MTNHDMRLVFVALSVSFVLLPSLSALAPKEGIVARQGETASPDGSKLVYYLDYDFYPGVQPPPPMHFRIADTPSGEVLHEIEVPYLGKTPPDIEWLDSRYVLVDSRFSVILDVREGTATETAYGYDFTMAPDATMLAYVHGYMPMYFPTEDPPEDHVFLWFRQEEKGWDHYVVYPETPGSQVVVTTDPPVEQRHIVVSNLTWSPSGGKLAFLAFQGGSYEVVVITVERTDTGLSATRDVSAFEHGETLVGFENLDEVHRNLTRVTWVTEPREELRIRYEDQVFKVPLAPAETSE